MLQVNLLANYLLKLSKINQINREKKNTEKRTFSQDQDNNNKRHLVSVLRHSSHRLDFHQSSSSFAANHVNNFRNYLILLVKNDLEYFEQYAKYISLTVREIFKALMFKLS
jgi:hypothetical protein